MILRYSPLRSGNARHASVTLIDAPPRCFADVIFAMLFHCFRYAADYAAVYFAHAIRLRRCRHRCRLLISRGLMSLFRQLRQMLPLR